MSDNPADRRIHARLQAQLEIEYTDPRGQRLVELRDLSQGGACLYYAGDPCDAGDVVELALPGADGKVAIKAEVMRVSSIDDGCLLGVRFCDSQVEPLKVVDYLLGVLLSGGGGGSREHPRIARRISVPCESPQEMIAVVENISLGGLAMNVDVPLELGEQVLVVLPAEDGEDLLSLQGRVVNQRPVEETDPQEYLVGLAFDEMTPQRRVLLDAMLVSLLKQ